MGETTRKETRRKSNDNKGECCTEQTRNAENSNKKCNGDVKRKVETCNDGQSERTASRPNKRSKKQSAGKDRNTKTRNNGQSECMGKSSKGDPRPNKIIKKQSVGKDCHTKHEKRKKGGKHEKLKGEKREKREGKHREKKVKQEKCKGDKRKKRKGETREKRKSAHSEKQASSKRRCIRMGNADSVLNKLYKEVAPGVHVLRAEQGHQRITLGCDFGGLETPSQAMERLGVKHNLIFFRESSLPLRELAAHLWRPQAIHKT